MIYHFCKFKKERINAGKATLYCLSERKCRNLKIFFSVKEMREFCKNIKTKKICLK